MLVFREIFVAKPGQASKMAKLMKEVMEADPNFKGRIMTDVVGDYNTVVIEGEIESLAAWEKQMEGYANMPPEIAEKMKNYTDMYLTGKREIFRVWQIEFQKNSPPLVGEREFFCPLELIPRAKPRYARRSREVKIPRFCDKPRLIAGTFKQAWRAQRAAKYRLLTCLYFYLSQ